MFPPPPPPKPLDEQNNVIGDILRFGEAAGGDAEEAKYEQNVANQP
jgi:hypothetical protein